MMLFAAAATESHSEYTPIIIAAIAGAASIIVAVVGNIFVYRSRSKPDATEIMKAELGATPGLSEKLMDALDKVRQLTDELTLAKQELSELRNDLAGTRHELELLREENQRLKQAGT